MALGIEAGHLQPGDRVALLGIGSGINVLMLAVDWQHSLVGGPAKRAAGCKRLASSCLVLRFALVTTCFAPPTTRRTISRSK